MKGKAEGEVATDRARKMRITVCFPMNSREMRWLYVKWAEEAELLSESK